MNTAHALLLANADLTPGEQLATGPLCKSTECRDRSASQFGGRLVVGTLTATVFLHDNARPLAEAGPFTLQLHGTLHLSRVADVMQRGRRVGVAVDVLIEAFDEADHVTELAYTLRANAEARATPTLEAAAWAELAEA